MDVIKLPKFIPGQVIDLSYKSGNFPVRVLVQSVRMSIRDKVWMYDIYLESTKNIETVSEKFLTDNMTNKKSKVYNCDEIIKLYADGWRFCGNFSENIAHETASKFATNRLIRNIILKPALNYYGSSMTGKYGIWIRYYNIINNDGTISNVDENSREIIVIK